MAAKLEEIQFDFFEKFDPVSNLEKRVTLLDKKMSNIQRGLFARFSTMEEGFNTLWSLVHMQRMEIEELKKMLGLESAESQFTFDISPLKYEKESVK